MNEKSEITEAYQEAIEDFCRDLGGQIYLLRLEKNWTLKEAALHVKNFMLKYQEEFDKTEFGEFGELMRLEHLIQMAMCYGKKVRIRFE